MLCATPMDIDVVRRPLDGRIGVSDTLKHQRPLDAAQVNRAANHAVRQPSIDNGSRRGSYPRPLDSILHFDYMLGVSQQRRHR